MQIQGYVQEIPGRQTSAGMMYDLIINGDKYGIGKFPPRDIKAGDYVEFVAEMRGNFRNVGRGTLRKVDPPAGSAATQNTMPSTQVTAPARQQVASSFDDRQIVISKQAALNTSIAFVKLAVDAGTINLGATPHKGGFEVLQQAVFEQARKFHLFSTGTDVEIPEPETAAKRGKGKVAPPAEAPDDGEWTD